jgi:hypothetical protein
LIAHHRSLEDLLEDPNLQPHAVDRAIEGQSKVLRSQHEHAIRSRSASGRGLGRPYSRSIGQRDLDPSDAFINDPARHEARLPDEPRNERRRRAKVDLLGRPEVLDSSRSHDRDAIRHGQRFALIVRHVHEADPDLALNPLELELHLLAQLQVQSTERLVEKEQRRPVGEGSRERDPLLLPSGQRAREAARQRLHANGREGLAHALLDLAPRHPPALRTEGDVLRHRHVREEGIALEDHVRVPLVGRHVRRIPSVDQDLSLRQPLEAGQHAERRRLAAPAGAEQREELAPAHIERHVVHGQNLAEPLDDAAEAQRRGLELLPTGRLAPGLRRFPHATVMPSPGGG